MELNRRNFFKSLLQLELFFREGAARSGLADIERRRRYEFDISKLSPTDGWSLV